MPGIQVFTRCNLGHETTRGTPVAPTRQFYNDGTATMVPAIGQNFHEQENTGRRYRIRRVTRQTRDVALKLNTAQGVSYDDLVMFFSALNGTATGAGAGADKTWTFTPSPTGSNAPPSWSIDVGDDVQNWRVQYAMPKSFKLIAGLAGVTQLESAWFGQQEVKTAAATPAPNTGIKIPSELWTIKFAASIAGLGAASIQTNFLQAFDLEVFPGNVWRHYFDGNLYGSQHVETDISAILNMTVESTALAVSEFYDKAVADTMDFIRLKATGPVLGGSNYSAQIDMPVLYEMPEILSGESGAEGINLYKVRAHLTDDGANGIIPVIVNSLAVLP